MRTETQEIIDAVQRINETLRGQLGDEDGDMDPWIWAEIRITQHEVLVMFMDECLYNSDNDEREYIEDGPSINHGQVCTDDIVPAHYEPMEPFLRKKMNELITKISTIKL